MHPTSRLLCQIYDELHRRNQVRFPLGTRHMNQIDSVVKTVEATYFGVQRFKTCKTKAVAYLYFIINDHPVTDGNKRLSVFWFEVYCKVNKLKTDEIPFGLDVLAVAIEKSDLKMEELLAVVEDLLFGS